MLFDTIDELYEIDLYRPDYYKIYSTSKNHRDLMIKDRLELMYSQIKPEKIRKSIKHEIKKDFSNGLHELFLHHFLISFGFDFSAHKLAESNLTSDFLTMIKNKKFIFEATTMRGLEERFKANSNRNRNGQVINALSKWEIPGLKLGISQLDCKTTLSPSLQPLKKEIIDIFNTRCGE